MELIQQLSQELKLRPAQVEAAVRLLDEGNTIPFIARYRKEMTDSLDDAALRDLSDRLEYLRNLQKRREEVIRSITEQEKLTPELETAIQAAATLAEVEDLYRPYKPKRRTRGSIAREKGLEPLAAAIRVQNTLREPLSMAAEYVNLEKGVETAEDALSGAMDIIAEDISDDGEIRKALRLLIHRAAVVTATGDSTENTTYKMYYDFKEPVGRIAPHRVLAINRGEKEGFLKTAIVLEEEKALEAIRRKTVIANNACGRAVMEAAADSWKRLIAPSMENETFRELFENASEQAIRVFAENLHHLLMQPPLTGQVVLGWDPGYRNGCKLAVVDATGRVLDTAVVYPTQPFNKIAETKRKVTDLLKKHKVTVISIGNGTASRESEKIVAELIAESGLPVQYAIVSEAGASVYSASKLASEEYPDLDVTTRGAMSLGRRLQDPLAELVKIPPQAIGVGQCGGPGTTAALAMLNDQVKKGGIMASSYVGGLSGAFIPVSEDKNMIDAASSDCLTIEKLEAMTCVCSVGLDMIAIPGDTSASTISGLIADEAAIGMVNQKTTAVRVIPVAGKGVGEMANFGGLMGYAPIMPVNQTSCEAFVTRGGRIPAPIHSFKN